MKTIGITTTVPVEVLLAAKLKPVDLNNTFVVHEAYGHLIDTAEQAGFPKSLCAWIKGLYGACQVEAPDYILGVIEGDCSNTKALLDVLALENREIIPFGFPHDQTQYAMEKAVTGLMDRLEVTRDQVEKVRNQVADIRDMVAELDERTWKTHQVSGFENHLWQVSSSDFGGDVDQFRSTIQDLLEEVRQRPANEKKLRLAYMGVPPMTGDLYDYVESLDAKILYNEVQREFAFPRAKFAKTIENQYLDFTYPYSLEGRLIEIQKQIDLRQIDGVIHYTQAFCHKAVEDIVVKHQLNVPVINIEGDRLNTLDARTKLRLEAWLDMLLDQKEGLSCE